MHHRRIATGAAAAALALLASACSDRLTAPAALPGAPSLAASASGLTLIPNTVRYRDTGARPATGRAGSAAVDALALLGADGYTDVEITARAADPARTATGTVGHAQARVYDDAGALRITRNAAGGAPVRIGGLPRGTRVDVQANVTGIDPHRTDVVTASTASRMRPDLRVEAGAGGSLTLYEGSPVVIMASVAELNGDMGAQADCVLLVDGVPTDQARGIWVDAGGLASCFFSTAPLTAGTHTFAVALQGVSPGDWDTSNNTATFQATVLAGPFPVAQTTHVRSQTYTVRNYWRTTYFNGWTGVDEEQEEREEGFTNTVGSSGYLGRGFTGPVTFRVVESSQGEQLQDDTWTEDDPGSPVTCFNRWNPDAGSSFYFCSYFGAASTFQFLRHSGTVTYHGRGYYREWDEGTGDEYVYHWNNDYTTSTGPARPLAEDYTLRVSFLSAGDETVLQSHVTLEPFTEEYVEPDWCFESGDVSWGWYDRSCYGHQSHATGWYGGRSDSSP